MRDGAGGMPGKIGKLHDEASESGSGPTRLCRPFDEFREQNLDDFIRVAGVAFLPSAYTRHGEFMMQVEHRRQERVLALEMIVERALGDACELGDFIDADSAETLSVEKLISGIENAAPGRFR